MKKRGSNIIVMNNNMGNARIRNAVGNNKYIVKEIIKADKFRIPYDILVKTLQSIMGYILWLILIQYVINAAIVGASYKQVFAYLCLFAVVEIVYIFIRSHYYELYAPLSNNRLYLYFEQKIISQSKRVELACYENPQFYDKYIKASTEVNNRVQAVINSISQFISNMITLTTVSTVMFKIDCWLIVFAIIPFALTLLLGSKQKKLNYDKNMRIKEVVRERDYVQRTFYEKEYSKEIKLSNIESVLLSRFSELTEKIKEYHKQFGFKLGIIEYAFAIGKDVLCYLGAILYISYRTVFTKTVLLGDAFLVLDSIRRVADCFKQIMDSYNELIEHSFYIGDLRDFLEYEPKIVSKLDNILVPSGNHVLKIENVSFAYSNSTKDVLKNINMEIKSNEKIAIVGQNGSGKSTLVKLLLRLYDVSNGKITLDGMDIRNYDVKSYRDMYGTIFQDFAVFSMSIVKNIMLSRNIQNKDVEKIIQALKASKLYDKLMGAKKGLDTTMTKEFDEDGIVLSGGEVQKVAIVRTFVKNNSIVILDEPSSALDPIAEAEMYRNMLEVCREKAVVFISHRLSSATLADHIYYMENGMIAEHGTHQELMKKNGLYANMFRIQAQNYISDMKE